MALYDLGGDELFGELLELRSLDPALYSELRALIRTAVLAHRAPRDLLREGAEVTAFIAARKAAAS